MANFNAGGAVGYATKGSISNSTIGNEEDNTKIVGTVFDHVVGSNMDAKVYYYHPSNIGGAIGYIVGKSEFNNVYTYTNVTTDSTYKLSIDESKDEVATLHMLKNYVATLNKIEDKEIPTDNDSEKIVEYLTNYYITESASKTGSGGLTNYDSEDGGIGGFAGRLDNPIFDKEDDDDISKVYGDIYAPYGINVGGIIGYWNNNADKPEAIKLPALPNDSSLAINVAGKIFVGGYIGKVNGLIEQSGEGGAPTPMFDINDIGHVNIQRVDNDTFEIDENEEIMVGNCIGGVIGYSKGEVSGIKLTGSATIKIYNSASKNIDSSYVGVIAGRVL